MPGMADGCRWQTQAIRLFVHFATATLMVGHPERARREIERVVGDDGLLLFHLADDGRTIGVSGLGPTSLAKEFKVARLMV
jgi:hypothetical protein